MAFIWNSQSKHEELSTRVNDNFFLITVVYFYFPHRTNSSTTRVGRFSYKERALKIYTDDSRPNNWNARRFISEFITQFRMAQEGSHYSRIGTHHNLQKFCGMEFTEDGESKDDYCFSRNLMYGKTKIFSWKIWKWPPAAGLNESVNMVVLERSLGQKLLLHRFFFFFFFWHLIFFHFSNLWYSP